MNSTQPFNLSVDLSLLKCPDCGGRFEQDWTCAGCGRIFTSQENFIDLLPKSLTQVKLGEDTVFAPDSDELGNFQDRIWRKIIGRLEIERFDREIIPQLPVGAFLELAGESCWAAAIYKSVNPQSTVFATDVSPNALQNLAIPLSRMFPHAPDIFAALDAETLPFQDAVIDCVFIESAMHHLPQPVQMLKEIKRVLKPGGRFVAVDHCVPPHFRFLFQNTADSRSQQYGIQEDLVSYKQWCEYFTQADIPLDSLQAYTNTTYTRNPLFALAGRIAAVLPARLNRTLFPVGLFVIYDKPA